MVVDGTSLTPVFKLMLSTKALDLPMAMERLFYWLGRSPGCINLDPLLSDNYR